jgi:hypothetical protein
MRVGLFFCSFVQCGQMAFNRQPESEKSNSKDSQVFLGEAIPPI